jgi:hypothetical protein
MTTADGRTRVAMTALPALAVAAVYATAFAVGHSALLDRGGAVIAAAIAFDLSLTSTALVWWLGVRRAGWPRWTLGVTFGIGLFTARMALPSGPVVTALVGAWLCAEVVLLTLAVGRIRRIVRVARAHPGPGPVAALAAGLGAAGMPARLAGFAAAELVAVGLALAGWFRRAPTDGFAMHRRKSWGAIVGALGLLIAAETVALHLLVGIWSPIAAWILTALSIYSAAWLAGDYHAIRLYPIRVTERELAISIGLRWRVAIPRDLVVDATVIDASPEGALRLGIVEPTVLLTLSRPVEVRGLFGITRRATAITLTIDEPERFLAALRG